jgi:hypothetical protein
LCRQPKQARTLEGGDELGPAQGEIIYMNLALQRENVQYEIGHVQRENGHQLGPVYREIVWQIGHAQRAFIHELGTVQRDYS